MSLISNSKLSKMAASALLGISLIVPSAFFVPAASAAVPDAVSGAPESTNLNPLDWLSNLKDKILSKVPGLGAKDKDSSMDPTDQADLSGRARHRRPLAIAGKIAAIDGQQFTLHTIRGQDVTVHITSSTIIGRRKDGKVSQVDLSVGDRVVVQRAAPDADYQSSDPKSSGMKVLPKEITAHRIMILPDRQGDKQR